MTDKTKINKKIEVMRMHKQEYDSQIGPCGEKRSQEHFRNTSIAEKDELFFDKESDKEEVDLIL
ncbi:MAG: hypothetical protein ACD_20C00050G0007 [uncultured bacterium]|nr:MAG: hypothetical protein ACD_20C00050G0007 [uncultured bacterium]